MSCMRGECEVVRGVGLGVGGGGGEGTPRVETTEKVKAPRYTRTKRGATSWQHKEQTLTAMTHVRCTEEEAVLRKESQAVCPSVKNALVTFITPPAAAP